MLWGVDFIWGNVVSVYDSSLNCECAFHTFFFRNAAFHNQRTCAKYTERDMTTFPLLSYIDQDSDMEEIFTKNCKCKMKTCPWSLADGRNRHLERLNKESGKKKRVIVGTKTVSGCLMQLRPCPLPAPPAPPGHMQTAPRGKGRRPHPGSLGGSEKERRGSLDCLLKTSLRGMCFHFISGSEVNLEFSFPRPRKDHSVMGCDRREKKWMWICELITWSIRWSTSL